MHFLTYEHLLVAFYILPQQPSLLTDRTQNIPPTLLVADVARSWNFWIDTWPFLLILNLPLRISHFPHSHMSENVPAI